MPAVTAPATILVTGANGFIAVATVKALVEAGFKVIGTVRTESKGQYIQKLVGDAFSYAIVPDLEKPDAFDDAVKLNPDGILHMASPVTTSAKDPQDTIGPAVTGTTGILHSILKYGPNVKRVVITSSAASLIEPKDEPYTYTEKDWNNVSAGIVEKEGINSPGIHIYRTSKVLAERAAWAFVENNKGQINFDLVTILPVLVYGPVYQEVTKDISSLNMTSAQLYNNFVDPKPLPSGFSSNIVDVRDVAAAHVLALQRPEAGGERFITSRGPFDFADLRDAAIKAGFKGIAPGKTEGYVPEPPLITVDGSKAERVLGLKYRTKEETAVDSIKSYYELFPSVNPEK